MKTLIEKIIQFRNPVFRFDPGLNTFALIQFSLMQCKALVRGLKLLLLFRKPKMAMLGAGTSFINLPRMKWGNLLKLGDQVCLSALGKEGITLGNSVSIGAYSRVIVSTTLNNLGEYIRIGNHVGIGEFAYLGGAGGLEIGDHCIAGQYLSCHPENHEHEDLETPIRLQSVTRKGIKVGKNCWLGSKVTILDGVTLGDGCIVAAGSVVNRSFPANSIIGGVPAKLIKSRTDENDTGLRLLRKSI
jgi:acetyltransferase-like isoleucine patch superfamily enzyme